VRSACSDPRNGITALMCGQRALNCDQGALRERNNQLKMDLLSQQKYICPYCKEKISIKNSHLDHIVPWEYVGDELSGNYQMLCSRCNERKGASPLFELSMLLYNTINQ